MINLNKTHLFYVLYDALRLHTEAVYFDEGVNPYRLYFNDKTLRIFIGNVHSAGRNDPDEFRIQCPGDLPAILSESSSNGEVVLVTGYSADVGVFCTWDPNRFIARSGGARRFSVYTRLSKMEEAVQDGLACHNDSDGQAIVMVRPDLLGLYADNATSFHEASGRQLERIARNFDSIPSNRPIMLNRRRVEITRIGYQRSNSFREGVLDAYCHQCAVCGIQLEVIEAAHIVPHSHPEGVDEVSNGLALCSLHHRSYDKGLLYVHQDYSIHLNEDRLRYLRRIGRSGGLSRYRRLHRDTLILPSEDESRPEPLNLVRGNQIRGIGLN